MTPKEKAIELFEKMVLEFPLQNNTNANVYYIAKQCALIAVDEILNVCEFHRLSAEKDWWQEVKKEIEKL
jgi:hypothetical protein